LIQNSVHCRYAHTIEGGNERMLKQLGKGIGELIAFAGTSEGRAIISLVTEITPVVIKKIDDWMSESSYEEAKRKIETLEQIELNKLKEVYHKHSHDMSPGVRQAYEERIAEQDPLFKSLIYSRSACHDFGKPRVKRVSAFSQEQREAAKISAGLTRVI
jgi:hypothetical protein